MGQGLSGIQYREDPKQPTPAPTPNIPFLHLIHPACPTHHGFGGGSGMASSDWNMLLVEYEDGDTRVEIPASR